MSDLSAAKYARITTFTKDGRAKHTPVWIAELQSGDIATTTDDDSWKVRRIRNTSRVELAVSNGRGIVEEPGKTFTGSARIIDCADPEYLNMERAFVRKYGLMYRVFRLIRGIRGKTACGIAVTLDRRQGA